MTAPAPHQEEEVFDDEFDDYQDMGNPNGHPDRIKNKKRLRTQGSYEDGVSLGNIIRSRPHSSHQNERDQVLDKLNDWRMQIENEHFTKERSPEESLEMWRWVWLTEREFIRHLRTQGSRDP